MTYDFRATQIRTNKIIASGSSGTNAKILVYPVDTASDYSGGITTSTFSTANIGTDVFFYTSGSISSRDGLTPGISLFGGDLMTSGAFYASQYSTFANGLGALGTFLSYGTSLFFAPLYTYSTLIATSTAIFSGSFTFLSTGSFNGPVTFNSRVVTSGNFIASGGFSGSLQSLADGTAYITGIGGISVTTQSNGSIQISGSAGGSSLPAGTNGGVLAYSGSNWVSTNSGSIYTPLVASGSGLPFYSSRVVPLQIGTSVALDADVSIGVGNSYKAITFRNYFNTTWIDVWRVDGSNYWTYGTFNTTDCSGTNILVPANGQFNLNRGGYVHLYIDGSGNTTFGSTVYQSTILGSSLIIGQTSVVSEYRGGAKVPETTISTDTTLGNSNEVVFVDTISAVVTASLPTGASGRAITIQRITGSNDLVIVRGSSDTIRAGGSSGLTELKITDSFRHGLIFRNAGTEWVLEY
jgi:hypothetical protein